MQRRLVACLLPALACVCPAAAADSPLYQGKPIDYWIKQLKDDDLLIREEAILVLADAGPAGASALPALKDMLKDPAATVRLKAAVAVWKIGRQADAAVPILAEAVKGGSRADRLAALDTLALIGADARAATAAVRTAMENPDADVRQRAATGFDRIGVGDAPVLADRLRDKSAAVRRDAAAALGRMGAAARDMAPDLKALLRDDDASVRLAAAGTLVRLAPADSDVVAVLLDGLKDSDVAVRRQVGDLLLAAHPPLKEAAPGYAALLKDNNVYIRLSAAEALWEVQGPAKDILPVLTDTLQGKDFPAQGRALALLARLGPEAKAALPDLVAFALSATALPDTLGDAFSPIGPDAVPPLIEALRGDDAQAGFRASNALGLLGPDSAPALLKLLDDPDPAIRARALRALGGVGPSAPGVMPALIEAAKNAKDPECRRAAVSALAFACAGPDAKQAVAVLLNALRDKDVALHPFALAALGRLRLAPEAALPTLDEAVKEDNPFVRIPALELRWRVDRKAGPAVDGLTKLLDDPAARLPALDALGRIAVEDKEAVPAIAARLQDTDFVFRMRALSALALAGPLAKGAAPELTELLKTKDRGMHTQAARILARLGEGADVVVPAAIAKLQGPPPVPAQFWAEPLGWYGKDAAPAAPVLRDLLQSPDPFVRAVAAESLCRIDPAEKPGAVDALLDEKVPGLYIAPRLAALVKVDPPNPRVREVLRSALADPDPEVRRGAYQACETAGPAARDAAPLIEGPLEDETDYIRLQAAAAYWKVGGRAEKAAALFAACLKDPTLAGVRRLAAVRLGEMGAEAKAAAPALRDALRDRSSAVRSAAADALRKVDAAAADEAGIP